MQSNIVPKHTNSLINESSPYLLQHAHNPVNWMPWCDAAFEKAKKENKLVLISIGYSACHWCHVMERECFEDEQVANIMNDFFINVKVDREERPDVDQVYMTAVQLMTQRGGWPLNCFVLPDGRPIYGGTYFPQQQWKNVLMNLADVWKNEPDKVLDYAQKLTAGIKQSDIIQVNTLPENFSINTLHTTVENWKNLFDSIYGGPDRAPKFPLPNNYLFLLRYAYQTKNDEILQHVFLTLDKMGDGGIYDQIGGGFARYSTDMEWKVPHFEKMLYDNAQLITLYSEAYKLNKNERYKHIVFETIQFIERELLDKTGAFYSALDADTEGEEGKFYVWKKEELQQLLGYDYAIAAAYYNVNDYGYWEHDNYVLIKNDSDETVAKSLNISIDELNSRIKYINEILFSARKNRISPGLDDKTLTSWNALMISALTVAYTAFNHEHFLNMAVKNANFICTQQLKNDATLYHVYKNGKSTVDGFLEDYSFTIEAFIDLYQCTFDEQWLFKAELLSQTAIKHFYDSESGFFYFTSNQSQQLISRKIEYADNVIPASCSSMANALFKLGRLMGKEAYETIALKMLNTIQLQIESYGAGYSNWCNLLLNITSPFYEVAIVGKAVNEKRASLQQHYIPNVIFTGSATKSNNHLLAERYVENKTLIYVCENKVCNAPTPEVREALKLVAVN